MPQRAHPARVVIAEDDDEQRELLERSLEEEGFEVLSLEDGFELLDYVRLLRSDPRHTEPLAVISDLHMPGETGASVLEEARALGMSCPVIVITGYPSEAVREQVLALGDAFFFPKPIDTEDLVRLLRGPIAHRQQPAERR